MNRGLLPDPAGDPGAPVVITGAGAGLGAAAAARVAGAGVPVVVVGHTPGPTRAVADALGAEWHVVELADLDDVRRLATELRERHPCIRALLNNAGVLFGGAVLTADGNELNMQVNALAPLLLALELLGPLAGGRVVSVGSRSHRWARVAPVDLTDPGRAGRAGAARYAASKFAAAVLTRELGRRHPAVTATVVDPGVVATGLWRHSGAAGRLLRVPVPGLVRTPARAARDLADVALAPPGAGGGHRGRGLWGRESPRVTDATLGAALWEAALGRLG